MTPRPIATLIVEAISSPLRTRAHSGLSASHRASIEPNREIAPSCGPNSRQETTTVTEEMLPACRDGAMVPRAPRKAKKSTNQGRMRWRVARRGRSTRESFRVGRADVLREQSGQASRTHGDPARRLVRARKARAVGL